MLNFLRTEKATILKNVFNFLKMRIETTRMRTSNVKV